MRYPTTAAVLGLIMILQMLPVVAQPSGNAADQRPVESYTPEIGEVMTFQQARHAKLWFAGKARNWELAGFEIRELREGFEAVAKYYPTLNDVPLAEMIDTIRDVNFVALDKAVEARDRAKFARAFDALTQACNACHQASSLGFVVIRRPTAPPFGNQTFSPRK